MQRPACSSCLLGKHVQAPCCAGSDNGSHQRRLSSASSLPAMTASRRTSDTGVHSRQASDTCSRSNSDGSAQPGLEVRDHQGSDSAEKRGSEAGSEGSRDQAQPRLTPRTRSASGGASKGGQCIAGGQRLSQVMWLAHLVLQQTSGLQGGHMSRSRLCIDWQRCSSNKDLLQCSWRGAEPSAAWLAFAAHLSLFAKSQAESSWMKRRTTCIHALGPSLAPYLSGAGRPVWHAGDH